MKCPYQTRVIHKPEYISGDSIYRAEDMTEFGDCIKTECPFYYTIEHSVSRTTTEHCARAERELRDRK